MATLQLWIERDSKQSVVDQLLMSASGKQLAHNDLAITYWDLNQVRKFTVTVGYLVAILGSAVVAVSYTHLLCVDFFYGKR